MQTVAYNSAPSSMQPNAIQQIENIRSRPQPAQRTDEWYIFRASRCTASDAINILKENTSEKFAKKKALAEFVREVRGTAGTPALEHGVK